jgi:hypothetical protein
MNLPQHIGSHPQYSRQVKELTRELDVEFRNGQLTDNELLSRVKNIQDQLRATVVNTQGKLK